MEIVGVDFSGAKTDNHTWVAQGILDHRGLTLQDAMPASRAQLTDLLTTLPKSAVAALDFPFSVPLDFARFWQPEATSMPELWEASSRMDLSQFIALRDDFVARCGESKRRCDTHFPECFSCLHKANPNMVPMTFYGMQMLAQLWSAGCAVPPLQSPSGDKALLLEAMPGAAIKAMHLPHKGYKKGARAYQLRERILEGLVQRSGVAIRNLSRFRSRCMASDDCLDAVVAAVVAALWARDPGLFWRPAVEVPEGADRVALLEGWLYAPVFLNPAA